MFVKNSPALQDAVDRILTIFETLIVNSGGLEEAEKLEQWRNAVRDIRQELESVRSIANRTDNVPHLLIGVDKYIRWTENLGMPGIPFPDWHHALFPPLESIAGHPWLLTVERRYDAGLLVQPPAPTTEAEASTLSTTPSRPRSTSTMSTVPSHGSQGVNRPYTNTKHSIGTKGGQGGHGGSGSDTSGRTTTGTRAKSSRRISKWTTSSLRVDDPKNEDGQHPNRGNPRERHVLDHERHKGSERALAARGKVGPGVQIVLSPVLRSMASAQLADRTTPPPNPQSCQTCINRKVVCIRSSGSGVCDPCRKRKIGCTPMTSCCPSTTRTTKVLHKATPKTTPSNPTTPRHQNKSCPPKPACEMTPAEEEDSPSPLPNKKPQLSKGGQAEALLSSVQLQQINTCINYPVPPPLQPDSSAYVPLPTPPMPPTSTRSSPVEISPPQPAPFDNTLLSIHQ
ncbi:hypothetical protein EV401DRAFT_1896517 [Pisolithus croceorrhizus]|nr:hypothetical protein EV401DRAFT_1896517 [Pisolithus croceorrhizus]